MLIQLFAPLLLLPACLPAYLPACMRAQRVWHLPLQLGAHAARPGGVPTAARRVGLRVLRRRRRLRGRGVSRALARAPGTPWRIAAALLFAVCAAAGALGRLLRLPRDPHAALTASSPLSRRRRRRRRRRRAHAQGAAAGGRGGGGGAEWCRATVAAQAQRDKESRRRRR